MNIEIYFSNLSEDVWPFIDSLAPAERAYEVAENAFLADRDLVTLDPNQNNIIILPQATDPTFIEYYRSVFKNSNCEVWSPAQHSGELCKDFRSDAGLWSSLVKLGKQHTLLLKSYSTSQAFLDLVHDLEAEGCARTTPDNPVSAAAWTVDTWGSKSGIRQLVQSITGGKSGPRWMGEGYTVFRPDTAAGLAAYLYQRDQGVVLKTNKAHAGAGILIFRRGELPDTYQACYERLLSILSQQKYWLRFPIVVEQFLAIDMTVGGGNPNCEWFINQDGQAEVLYFCSMRVTAEGVFKGVEIGPHLFSADIEQRLLEFGQTLGQHYATTGYRGYYDVDCVYTLDKELLITESNVRRTGGTHVYLAMKYILGADFVKTHYVLSNNTYQLPGTQTLTFTQLKNKLTPVLYDAQTQEGVILVSANILKQHKLSYIVAGRTQKTALKIETEMERLLGA